MPCFQRGMAVSEKERCYARFMLGNNETCCPRGFCGVQWGKTKETTILKNSPYVFCAADSEYLGRFANFFIRETKIKHLISSIFC